MGLLPLGYGSLAASFAEGEETVEHMLVCEGLANLHLVCERLWVVLAGEPWQPARTAPRRAKLVALPACGEKRRGWRLTIGSRPGSTCYVAFQQLSQITRLAVEVSGGGQTDALALMDLGQSHRSAGDPKAGTRGWSIMTT